MVDICSHQLTPPFYLGLNIPQRERERISKLPVYELMDFEGRPLNLVLALALIKVGLCRLCDVHPAHLPDQAPPVTLKSLSWSRPIGLDPLESEPRPCP